ncbi:SgcJ/EcaC family oxidoreductase [Allorhizocola rhizosphaerae]|uniref:SgcJ/EcaC family oxidoreductase n=1 Tax=Allorhizocola rhizosphaerae TaxID=1872709 RepID=UPI000E3CAEFB|nr:SgcJ/EcaC family oxidoreductase [Allorhizocola rhizosphaerae]
MRRTPRFVVTGALAAALALGAAACGTSQAAGVTAYHAATAAGASQTPTKETIANLFAEWNASLATGDPQRVADRYAPDAVLLPTLSNNVRTDRNEIVDYFIHFLEGKPQGAIKESTIHVLDDNTAVDAGVYVFTLTKDGKQQQVEARYTYVYELRDGKWLIINHHSSAMPEKTG